MNVFYFVCASFYVKISLCERAPCIALQVKWQKKGRINCVSLLIWCATNNDNIDITLGFKNLSFSFSDDHFYFWCKNKINQKLDVHFWSVWQYLALNTNGNLFDESYVTFAWNAPVIRYLFVDLVLCLVNLKRKKEETNLNWIDPQWIPTQNIKPKNKSINKWIHEREFWIHTHTHLVELYFKQSNGSIE